MNYVRKRGISWRTIFFSTVIILLPGAVSQGATFINPVPITINSAGTASPYPSGITVPALAGDH